MASRPLRSRQSDFTSHSDKFDEPARKLAAVKEPKEHEPAGTPIRLLKKPLDVEVGGA